MYKLSVERQEQISGGSALTYIVYALLGIAGLNLLRSAKGRLRLGRLITLEWGNQEEKGAIRTLICKEGEYVE